MSRPSDARITATSSATSTSKSASLPLRSRPPVDIDIPTPKSEDDRSVILDLPETPLTEKRDGKWASEVAASAALAHAAELPRSILSQAADNASRARLARQNPELAAAYERTLRESNAYRTPSNHARLLLLLLIVAFFWYAFNYHYESYPAMHPDEWREAFMQDGDANMHAFQSFSP